VSRRTRFDVVREDSGEYVAEWDGREFRASNPFGLDSKLSEAGAPFPRDLYLIEGVDDE
jgi:hypothetical protein